MPNQKTWACKVTTTNLSLQVFECPNDAKCTDKNSKPISKSVIKYQISRKIIDNKTF